MPVYSFRVHLTRDTGADMNDAKTIYTCEDAADFVSVKVQTLAAWRMLGRGPAFIRLGRAIRYRRADLERYLEEQTVRPGKGELVTA